MSKMSTIAELAKMAKGFRKAPGSQAVRDKYFGSSMGRSLPGRSQNISQQVLGKPGRRQTNLDALLRGQPGNLSLPGSYAITKSGSNYLIDGVNLSADGTKYTSGSGNSSGMVINIASSDVSSANIYFGKSVNKAVNNINHVISAEINMSTSFDQESFDKFLIELDGTSNKERLGANTILALSIAFAKAQANKNDMQLYKYNNIKKTIKSYQKFIKENLKFVGENFAYEARSIHYNPKKKSKGIYGNASKKDLKELKEEGLSLIHI